MLWSTLAIISGFFMASAIASPLRTGVNKHDGYDNDNTERYIVVFKEATGLSLQKRSQHHKWIEKMVVDGKSQVHGYLDVGKKISGYHGRFTKKQVQQIKDSEDVAFVEQDSEEKVQSLTYLQSSTPWGLSRISHLDNQFMQSRKSEYIFKDEGGQGSVIYILDTGVMTSHKEFEGRVRWGANFANKIDADENGHGTHVAGIAAGYSVGVAKFAEVVAVKILDAAQRGTLSNFIKAVSWIIDDHKKHPGQKSVINYSAVGKISKARNMAIDEAVKAGIMFVGAAGNKGADACQFGPPNNSKGLSGQLSVAALNFTDHPASFSNYGGCVDVYAPGVNVRSSINQASNAYGTMSGTSMASPHVAGLAAYYWSIYKNGSLKDIAAKISNHNENRVQSNFPGTVNKIAYNNA